MPNTSNEAEVIAIIPARGGSKGIPAKNLQVVGGLSLIARAIRSAKLSTLIDEVYVSTDNHEIAREAELFGAKVILRPISLAEDSSSSESALLHGLDQLHHSGVNPKTLVFMQATSPFIHAEDLDAAVARVKNDELDVCFSAFKTYAFLWEFGSNGLEGVNHSSLTRQRRQDRTANFQETGAFYVMKVDGFRQAGFRFFGRIGLQEVSEAWSVEIDDFDQLEIAKNLAHSFPWIPPQPSLIKALVMDFDGVHTDDTAQISEEGKESVTVSRSDGFGLERLKRAGVPMLILSKESNHVVAARAKKLGIEVAYGVENKLPILEKWCADLSIGLENVCYIGNDLNDLDCLRAVGWPTVPKDANASVVPYARIVTSRTGGKGALREVADMIYAQLPKSDTEQR